MTTTKGFDRSKFQGAKLSSNKTVVDEAKKNTESKSSGRAGYLTLGEGKTILRIAPPHDPESPSLQPICKAWLPREVGDDGKKELKNMPVFSSRVHSPIGRDLVDEYIQFLSGITYKELSKDEAKKRLAPVNGCRTKDGKWVSGIRPNLGFVGYAWKEDEFGRVELSRTVVDRMNELSIDEESDETITVDPFSDPDNGVNLILEYDSKADSNKKWKINRGQKPRPLTDAQLMELDEVESLADMFTNAFTREDFENQVAGLKLFDDKNEFGIMDMEEFVSIMEEIQDLVWNCADIRETYKTDDEGGEKSEKKAPTKSVEKAAPVKTSGRTVSSRPKIEDDEPEVKKSATANTDALFPTDDGLEDLDMDDLKELIEDQGLEVEIKSAYPKSKVIKLMREAIALKNGAAPADDLPFTVDEKREEPKKGSFRDRVNKK